MNTEHLKRVRRMFVNDLTPVKTQRHNMRAWVVSLRHLGDKWLLANPKRMADKAVNITVAFGGVFVFGLLAIEKFI